MVGETFEKNFKHFIMKQMLLFLWLIAGGRTMPLMEDIYGCPLYLKRGNLCWNGMMIGIYVFLKNKYSYDLDWY